MVVMSQPKKGHGKEVPLDKYVSELYESQLRRFPKTRTKLE